MRSTNGGITIHHDSALEGRQLRLPIVKPRILWTSAISVEERLFTGKKPNIIKYHLGRAPVAIDGNALKEQGGVDTEWEDATTRPARRSERQPKRR